MNMTAASQDPLRRSALTLHALPERDRQWLLASLPKLDADRLAPLLRELQALGIPGDASLLPAAPDGPRAERPRWPQALDSRSVAALVAVLSHEPNGVARKLLSLRAWAWAPAVVAGMAASAREEIARGEVRAHGARFETALLDALQKQVEVQPEGAQVCELMAGTIWQRARGLAGKGSTR